MSFSFGSRSFKAAALALTLSIGGVSAAQATVVSSTSNAYGEYINLSVTPLLGIGATVGSGPFPSASGSAPAPYFDYDALAAVNIGGIVHLGVLENVAASNVDGGNGVRYASAGSNVGHLEIGLLSSFGTPDIDLGLGIVLPGIPAVSLLSISSGTIVTNATISGDYGALSASGGTTIEGLGVSALGLLNLGVDVSPLANTTLVDLLGLKIVINEQTLVGDGISALEYTVNAIHVYFDNVVGILDGVLGLLNGDIIIGHSYAAMTAAPTQTIDPNPTDPTGPTDPNPNPNEVPAPASLLLLGAGLLALGWRRKRA